MGEGLETNGYVRWKDLEELEQRIRYDFRLELTAMEGRLRAARDSEEKRLCEDITEVKKIATDNRRTLDQLRGAKAALYFIGGTSISSLVIAMATLYQLVTHST
jgi:hypothetical protein